jgi:outer membrane protein assembly factor BamB
MKCQSAAVVVLLLPLFLLSAFAADWPQWRGPKQDNVSTEKGLLQEWPKDGPKLLWTFRNAGEGYSCPAIVGDRLYLSGARGDAEYIFALDLKQAQGGALKELWAAKIGPKFAGTAWNAGPIATPAVDGGMVYALGGAGDLVGVTTDGKEVWRKSLQKDLEGEVNPIDGGIGSKEGEPKLGWGYAGSPFVDGEQLIVAPGGLKGTLAALDKKTGNVIWRSKELTDQASYSSPLVATIGGVRQYIILTNQGVAGIAAKDGALLWKYTRKPAYSSVVIPTPLVHDNLVFVSVGHGGASAGCDLIKIEGNKAEKVYGNRNLLNQQGGYVLVGGNVYGHSDRKGWTCLDLKTGKDLWSERSSLGAAVTCADGNLYCLSEEGEAVLAEASSASRAAGCGRRRSSPTANCSCATRICCSATTLR